MTATLVTVRNYATPFEAELARMRLSEGGIPSYLKNSEIISAYPLLGNAVGYIPLEVSEEHFAAADRLLKEPLPDDGSLCVETDDQSQIAIAADEPDETPDADDRPGLLAGWRELAKSAIAAYLLLLLFWFVVSALGLLFFLAEKFVG